MLDNACIASLEKVNDVLGCIFENLIGSLTILHLVSGLELCHCLSNTPNRYLFLPGELLSQPRPEGVTEIICPKNGNERVNVALVYPPIPTVISPCSK